MTIGFGDIALATLFLACVLFISYALTYFSQKFVPSNNSRRLTIEIAKEEVKERKKLLSDLENFSDYLTVTMTEKRDNGNFCIHMDIRVTAKKTEELEDFLLNEDAVVSYSL